MTFLNYADRVAETTTTNGTGTIQLLGASDAKFRTFIAGVGSGVTVPYVMVHRTANEWEVGYGIVTAGSPDTLTRGGVYSSSTGGGAVSFTAGTKDVFLGLPASKTLQFDNVTGDARVSGGFTSTGPSLFASGVGTGDAYVDIGAGRSGNGYAYLDFVGDTTWTDYGLRIIRNNSGANASSFISHRGTGEFGFFTAETAPMTFYTSGVERARITGDGYFKASNNGTYAATTSHELRNSLNDNIAAFTNSAASAPYGVVVKFTNAAPDNNDQYFLLCADNVTNRCIIYADGDVLNHDGVYGTISDAKLKQDVVDAGSQWDDIKAIRFRKYRFISDVEAKGDDAQVLLGVVAQELQATSPGLVEAHPDTEQVEVVKDVEVTVEKSRPVLDEDGEPVLGEDGEPLTETYTEIETRTETTTETRSTGTETLSVKSSVLLMKAAVALQEAMARIESLEARLAAAGID